MYSYKGKTVQALADDLKVGKQRVINELIDQCNAENGLVIDVTTEPDWGDVSIQRQAYTVACIDVLCEKFKVKKPGWIFNSRYVLDDPYFAVNARGVLRLVLLIESPAPFKSRNIYVSKNVLERV